MRSLIATWPIGSALAVVVFLTACGQAPAPTASPSPTPVVSATPTVPGSSSPSASAMPSASATPSSTAEPTATVPEPSLPPFACETLEIVAAGEVDQAIVTDVRVGRHAEYDRVVFEFGRGRAGGPPGVPAYSLTYVWPPLTKFPSDLPLEVPGSTFMEILLQGGTKLDEDFNLVYDGPTRFDPEFPMLIALYERGDFEAVSGWYLGLDHEPCIRVFTLTDPPRLVIDLQHSVAE